MLGVDVARGAVLALGGMSPVALGGDNATEGPRRSATAVSAADAATTATTMRARFRAALLVDPGGVEWFAVSPRSPTGGTDTCESPPSGVTIVRPLAGTATA